MKVRSLLAVFLFFAVASASVLAYDPPDAFKGAVKLTVSGDKEWKVTEYGECGNQVVTYRNTISEYAEVVVPYIASCGIADPSRPSTVTGRAEYIRYKDGTVIEYWKCKQQQVPTPPYTLWAYVVALPGMPNYQTGITLQWLKGEHATFDDDGHLLTKETGDYRPHIIDDIQLPVPEATDRLTGQKDVMFEDWIKARLIWDWTPATD